jgi:hypothetical protein
VSSRSSHGEGGNGSCAPCLKSRDNYGPITFTFGSKLHSEWGPRLRRSVHSGWTKVPWHSSGLPSVLLASREFLALRWTMPEMVIGDVASWRCFTWLLRLPTWGLMWKG